MSKTTNYIFTILISCYRNTQHASVKMSLLRTFGLSRRGQAKDEVTERITSDPGVSSQLNHSLHATVIATESLNLPPSTPSSNPRHVI